MNIRSQIDAEAVSELIAAIADEFCERLDKGENPDIEQYAQRHPQQADVIRRTLNALHIMRAADPLSELPGGRVHDDAVVSDNQLGDFQILREIGRGGMGVVFEAQQISLARRVAIKILPFAALWPETALARFRQEVRVAAQLEHPHIVPIYAVGCERGVHFYAMKLIDGCSIADVIRFRQAADTDDSPISPISPIGPMGLMGPMGPMDDRNWYHAAARLGQTAAQALAFAHQHGVIHRDIKPANLLLNRAGHLFVTDFGLARFTTDVNLTHTGDLLGTPRYMSPEQAACDSKQLDERTDIYSLGATLYELLTLHPVIAERGRAAAVRSLKQLQVIPPRTHDRHLPRPLEQIVLKCLQAKPGDRYGTASELADDLQRFLDGRPVAARPPGLTRRGTRWVQQHPRATLSVIVSVVTCLLLTAIGTWIAQQRRYASPTPRGPPSGELVATSSDVSSPIDSNPAQESPDMLAIPEPNVMTKTGKAPTHEMADRSSWSNWSVGTS